MKRLLLVTTFLLISTGYGESFENPLQSEDLYKCYSKLICEMDKIEEFYGSSILGGPETSQVYVNLISKIMNVKDPVKTLAYWNRMKETYCAFSDKRQKQTFNDWCASVGEHMLEVCIDPKSEMCLKAELAADEFAAIFAKYKAMGECTEDPGVPRGMIPGGMGKMPSPFG